ncbi:hypothetical protein ACWC2K_32445 [Streptomyces chattanoogensis]|uniref:hypothetical protein n=1 Tax=Streptomyces chattanoogensis TaxID=66876 RepID=UPI0036C6820A
MRGTLTPHRTLAAVLAMAAAGTVALTGCGTTEKPVKPAAMPSVAPSKQPDVFERRAGDIVRHWPKHLAPMPGRREAVLPLVSAERPKDAGKREITVTVGHSACDVHFGARQYESKDVVVVSGWGKKKSAKGMCTEMLATDKVKVKLEKPLGGRKLIDAATGKQLAAG